MTDTTPAKDLIARLEASGAVQDTLIACLISELKEWDRERDAVDHLQALQDHRKLVAARTTLIVEAAQLRVEIATGQPWGNPIEAAMPAVYPL